jgi:hypothetical protein
MITPRSHHRLLLRRAVSSTTVPRPTATSPLDDRSKADGHKPARSDASAVVQRDETRHPAFTKANGSAMLLEPVGGLPHFTLDNRYL